MEPVRRSEFSPGALDALAAAALFGVSTPAAKLLLGTVPPVLMAGLLYLGSGIGLGLWWVFSRKEKGGAGETPLSRRDLPWLGGAILSGGVVAPVLLMLGLARTPAAASSLLLNLEGVLTAVAAWAVFRENFGRRVLLGMAAITAGGLVLSWGGSVRWETQRGPAAIVAACLAWALDNNLTKKVSGSSPVQIAAVKGLIAGAVNVAIGLSLRPQLPPAGLAALSGLVGFAGYGVSLVLFVLALRRIGAARTGAYFSVGPFVGAVAAIPMLGERVGAPLLLAGALMAFGVCLYLTESHRHEHFHEPVTHAHRHMHDAHHAHEHGGEWAGPHAHEHAHSAAWHTHPHYPDLHHTHEHP